MKKKSFLVLAFLLIIASLANAITVDEVGTSQVPTGIEFAMNISGYSSSVFDMDICGTSDFSSGTCTLETLCYADNNPVNSAQCVYSQLGSLPIGIYAFYGYACESRLEIENSSTYLTTDVSPKSFNQDGDYFFLFRNTTTDTLDGRNIAIVNVSSFEAKEIGYFGEIDSKIGLSKNYDGDVSSTKIIAIFDNNYIVINFSGGIYEVIQNISYFIPQQSYHYGERALISIQCHDLDNDGKDECVFLGGDGYVYAVNILSTDSNNTYFKTFLDVPLVFRKDMLPKAGGLSDSCYGEVRPRKSQFPQAITGDFYDYNFDGHIEMAFGANATWAIINWTGGFEAYDNFGISPYGEYSSGVTSVQFFSKDDCFAECYQSDDKALCSKTASDCSGEDYVLAITYDYTQTASGWAKTYGREAVNRVVINLTKDEFGNFNTLRSVIAGLGNSGGFTGYTCDGHGDSNFIIANWNNDSKLELGEVTRDISMCCTYGTGYFDESDGVSIQYLSSDYTTAFGINGFSYPASGTTIYDPMILASCRSDSVFRNGMFYNNFGIWNIREGSITVNFFDISSGGYDENRWYNFALSNEKPAFITNDSIVVVKPIYKTSLPYVNDVIFSNVSTGYECSSGFNGSFTIPEGCGDGIIQKHLGEECEFSKGGGQIFGAIRGCHYFDDCTGGNLSCDPVTCRFDLSECTGCLGGEGYCGDGIVQVPNDNGTYERCDGSNLDGKHCGYFDEYIAGSLSCLDDCSYNFSGCYAKGDPDFECVCGDGVCTGEAPCFEGFNNCPEDCGYANETRCIGGTFCIPSHLVEVESLNDPDGMTKGVLPQLYFGLISFFNNTFDSMLIIIATFIMVSICILLAGIIFKLMSGATSR